jgi:hypothetical protein
MIPNASGTLLINKALNGKDTIPLNWTLDNIKNINEIRVVAFVQNTTTKEVYQAQLFTPQINSVSISEGELKNLNEVILYPNPSFDELSISLPSAMFLNNITIFNQIGEAVYSNEINRSTDLITINPELSEGVYFLRINSNDNSTFRKVIISK